MLCKTFLYSAEICHSYWLNKTLTGQETTSLPYWNKKVLFLSYSPDFCSFSALAAVSASLLYRAVLWPPQVRCGTWALSLSISCPPHLHFSQNISVSKPGMVEVVIRSWRGNYSHFHHSLQRKKFKIPQSLMSKQEVTGVTVQPCNPSTCLKQG